MDFLERTEQFPFLCVFFQGGKSEIFVDVIERMSVVIGSNVSNMDAGRSVSEC